MKTDYDRITLPFLRDQKARETFESICAKNNVPVAMMLELLHLELEKRPLQRRHGLFQRIDEIIPSFVDEGDQNVH
jgi:hypothetical protein